MDTARKHLQTSFPGRGYQVRLVQLMWACSKNLCSKLDLQTYGVKKIAVTFEFDSAEDYTKFNQDIVAPIHTMLSNETEKYKRAGME